MKIIKHRLILLTSLCIMVLLFSMLLYVNNFVIFSIDMRGSFALLILTSALLIVLFIREFEVYRIAKLIIENKIMHIEAAEINKKSNDVNGSILRIDSLEIFISCFGILLGSKIIKFNTEGISLKKVEIGRDFIYIVYGKGEKNEIIRLLHGVLGEPELQSIIERFRHETGIIPIVLD